MNISLTIAGILSVSLLRALLHFTYRQSDRNSLISPTAPVNKSAWEHMKLLFFPMLLSGLWSLKGETNAYRTSTLHAGPLMGTLPIPMLCYSYTSALGHSILAVDVAISYIRVIAAFLIYHRLPRGCLLEKYSHVTPMVVLLLLICLLLSIYFPPGFSTFKDPEGRWGAAE